MVYLEEVQIAAVVERRRRVGLGWPAVARILEIIPVMASRQENSASRAIGEIPGIRFQYPQRTGRRRSGYQQYHRRRQEREGDAQAGHGLRIRSEGRSQRQLMVRIAAVRART